MAEAMLNQILEDAEIEEDFSASMPRDEGVSLHGVDVMQEKLYTHRRIKNTLSGNVIEIEKGYAIVNLQTTQDMIIDELGLIHSGFIFSAADFAAAAAVNESNVVIIGSRTSFLAPAKLNDLIEFEAKAKFEDSRKREITVTGKIKEIKIFEGIFHAVVLEKHIFKTKIKNAHRDF